MAEFKYPPSNNTIVFLFDQNSGHLAFSNDTLIAHKMTVSDGVNGHFYHTTKDGSKKWFTKRMSHGILLGTTHHTRSNGLISQ